MKQAFKVTGMSCQHCVARVEKGLSTLTGVQKAKVNLKKELATVKYDEALLSVPAIIAKIQEVGYEAEVV